jgi:hypothetical protein
VLAERDGDLLAQAGRSEGGEGATEGTPATRHGIRLLRAGVATLAEQELHLLLGDDVAVGEVETDDAAAEPAARRLALLLVVGGQPDLASLGPVVGRDLPGQVRVPAPGGELVQRHHTPQSRGKEGCGQRRVTQCTRCVLNGVAVGLLVERRGWVDDGCGCWVVDGAGLVEWIRGFLNLLVAGCPHRAIFGPLGGDGPFSASYPQAAQGVVSPIGT